MKKLLPFTGWALLGLAYAAAGWGQSIFTKYGPVAGIQKNTGATFQDTAAISTDISLLFCSSSSTNYLRADGTCAVPPGGVALNTANTWTALQTFSNAAIGIVINDASAPTDTKNTQINVSTAGGFRVQSATDAAPGTGVTNAFAASRTGSAWSNITLSNTTDNAPVVIAGTGGISGVGTALTALSATNLTSGLASATIGGTGVASPTAHGVLIAEGASAATSLVLSADNVLRGVASADPAGAAVPNCGSATTALNYSTTTHAFGCQTITSGGTGTVTSVGSGAGLTGGPITGSGSLAIDFTANNTWSGTGTWSAQNALTQAGSFTGVNALVVTNTNTGTAAQAQLTLNNSATSGSIAYTSTTSSAFGASSLVLANSGANPIRFVTNSTERFNVPGTGGISIDTPASGAAISALACSGCADAVFTGAAADAARVGIVDGSTGNRQYQLRVGGVATGTFDILDATGGASRFSITSGGAVSLPSLAASSSAATGSVCWTTGGNLTVDTTVACLSSTIRVKQDVEPLDIGLPEVLRMRPVSYNLRPEFNPQHLGPQVGMIAEEVQQIDPRLVAVDDDGQARGIRYMQLTAVLVKAVQQQQREIKGLVIAVAVLFAWCAILQLRVRRRG